MRSSREKRRLQAVAVPGSVLWLGGCLNLQELKIFAPAVAPP